MISNELSVSSVPEMLRYKETQVVRRPVINTNKVKSS